MAVSSITATIHQDIHKVWETVLDVKNYSAWRSDLGKTEILNETQFVEYTKTGYATTFTTTVMEPYRRWEFDLENDTIKGHWTGVFTEAGNSTQIEFTEEVTAKKFLMKLFVKPYLKKQQAQFLLDLKNAL